MKITTAELTAIAVAAKLDPNLAWEYHSTIGVELELGRIVRLDVAGAWVVYERTGCHHKLYPWTSRDDD